MYELTSRLNYRFIQQNVFSKGGASYGHFAVQSPLAQAALARALSEKDPRDKGETARAGYSQLNF